MPEIIDLETQEVKIAQKGFMIAEKTLLVVVGIGFLFKFFHFPGATFFWVLGMGGYTLLMFPIGLAYNGWITKIINFFSFFLIIGTLFSLLMWAGNIFLSLGALSSLGVLLPLLIFARSKNPEYFRNHKIIVIRLALFSILILSIKIMHPKSYYETFVNDDPIEIDLYYKTIENPEDSEAKEDYFRYRKSKRVSFNSEESQDESAPK